MTGRTLATELAARLAAVAPKGFTVSASNGVVDFTSNKVTWGASFVADLFDQPDDCEEGKSIESAAWNALSAAQDYISEVDREMWPADAEHGYPHATIEGDELKLWYGECGNATLELPNIPLFDVLENE